MQAEAAGSARAQAALQERYGALVTKACTNAMGVAHSCYKPTETWSSCATCLQGQLPQAPALLTKQAAVA